MFGKVGCYRDHTLVFKYTQRGKQTIILVYIDNIIITRDDLKERQQLKKKTSATFELKDLGRLKYFLGIKVAHSNKDIFISYIQYVIDLLQELEKIECKPTSIPIEQNII